MVLKMSVNEDDQTNHKPDKEFPRPLIDIEKLLEGKNQVNPAAGEAINICTLTGFN